jgi:hypothetical protein
MARNIKLKLADAYTLVNDLQLADGTTVEAGTHLPEGTEVVLGDAMDNLLRMDVRLGDSDGLFFQRQLEAIETQSYDVLYPDLEARLVFKTNTFGGAGATSLTYRSYDHVGSAQVISARATDLPKSDISGKEYTLKVKSVGVSYDFDIDELLSAQMAGMPLEARKAMAAKRGYEEFINTVVWYGDDVSGLKGLFSVDGAGDNAHGITEANVVGGVWATAKAPDAIIADLNTACNAMYSGSKKIFRPKEILMNVEKWNYINSTPRSINSDTTILAYFLANNQFISDKSQIKELNAVEGQGKAGAECFIVMTQTSPEGLETIRIRETLPLAFLPVQLHGMVYEIPGRGRFAGLEVTYPFAIAIWSGI